MKQLQYNFIKILTIILTLTVVSCNEYLSELPDNRTDINSEKKISSLLIGAYPIGNYQRMAELMSDNAQYKNIPGQPNLLNEQMYTWQNSNNNQQDDPNFYWTSCYKAISQANQALVSIKKIGGGAKLNPQKGEALLSRAYAHFMLVNFWGKHYDPKTAKTDLGVPYVFKPETVLIKTYKRNTVQEVYDFIEKDMLDGLELVKSSYKIPKFHFTKEAGYAFATRFYTFKGKWDKVITYANKAVSNPSTEIRNMIEYETLSFDHRTLRYAGSTEDANLLLVSTISWWGRRYRSSHYALNKQIREKLFVGSNGNPFNKSWAYRVYGSSNRSYNLPKIRENFRITNQSARTGFGYLPVVLLGKDEVLLNRAEAYVMKNNYANALKDLTIFLSKKTIGIDVSKDILTEEKILKTFEAEKLELTPHYTLNKRQQSFLKAILLFRQREFYHEGMRWFDVRRFKIVFTRDYKKSGVIKKITLKKNDLKRQLQIPESALSFGLKPNPR